MPAAARLMSTPVNGKCCPLNAMALAQALHYSGTPIQDHKALPMTETSPDEPVL